MMFILPVASRKYPISRNFENNIIIEASCYSKQVSTHIGYRFNDVRNIELLMRFYVEETY